MPAEIPYQPGPDMFGAPPTIHLPDAMRLAHAVIEHTRAGFGVFFLIPGTKSPLKASRGLYDATNDTARALALGVACAKLAQRRDLFDMPADQAKRAVQLAFRAEPVHRFEQCSTDGERVALFVELMGNLRCPNLAVRTGPESRVIVIDYDPRKDTDGSQWTAFIALLNGVPDTLTMRTRDGGYHFYFRWPTKLDSRAHRKSLAKHPASDPKDVYPAFDVKGAGGYALTRPSAILPVTAQPALPARGTRPARAARVAATGGYYTVENDHPIADLPKTLLDRLVTAQRLTPTSARHAALGAGIPTSLAGLASTNADLGGIGPLPDTPSNRTWLAGVIDHAYAHRMIDKRGRWDRNDWWAMLAAILSTRWHDRRAIAQEVSMRPDAGWNEERFEYECDDIEAREASGVTNGYGWRGLRADAWKAGYRGPYNPPDLPEGGYIATPPHITDAELVNELAPCPRAALVEWASHHLDDFQRIKPALAIALAQQRERSTPSPTQPH